jgi:hypothetical protein
MNTIEDRIRAAARAAADTVPPDSVPPLRLPAGRPSRFHWRRDSRSSGVVWAGRLAPVAAALAVVAIVISVVTLSRTGSESSSSTSTAAPGGVTPGPPISTYVKSGQVPPYYVAITSHGNPNFNSSYAVVQETVSGTTLATITAAADGTIVAVTAAADDRTFVLDEQHGVTDNQSFQARTFVMVRLNSSGQPVSLNKLPISVPSGEMMTGLALSPSGRQLAIAVQPDNVKNEPNLQEIRLYTLGTGAVRTWSGNGTIGSGPDDARSVSWTADGRTLAFDWIGNNAGTEVVRLLNVGGHGSSLLADSRLATSLTSPQQQTAFPSRPLDTGTASRGEPGSSVVPNASHLFPQITLPATATPPALACQEDSIITPDGSAIVCSAIQALNAKEVNTGTGLTLQRGAGTGFFEYSTATGKVTHVLGYWTFGNVGALSVDVLWSNPSGSVLIAVIPTAANGRMGVISGNTFTPIPAPVAGVAPLSGAW